MYNKRLVTFGCSYVAGDAMPDVWAKSKKGLKKISPGPSTLVFPALVAKEINAEYINEGEPGASNLHIISNIENFEFKDDDIVIIHWSFMNRSMYKTSQNENVRILPSSNSILSRKFYSYQNDLNMWNTTKICFNYANYRLQNLGISKVINFSPLIPVNIQKAKNKFNLNCDFPSDNNNLIHFHSRNKYPDTHDLAEDNSHPGPKTHQKFANYILEEYPWLKE